VGAALAATITAKAAPTNVKKIMTAKNAKIGANEFASTLIIPIPIRFYLKPSSQPSPVGEGAI
jgi:hypothetical protein